MSKFEEYGVNLRHTMYFNMKDSESILDAVKVVLQVPKSRPNAEQLLLNLRSTEIQSRLDTLKKRDLEQKEKV